MIPKVSGPWYKSTRVLSAIVVLLVAILKTLFPDLNISDEVLTTVMFTGITYILGKSVENAVVKSATVKTLGTAQIGKLADAEEVKELPSS